MPARDALRRLAEGPDHRTAVAAAAAATGDVERAASFVARGGVHRLDRAIVAAEREGDEAAARVGRAARKALTDVAAGPVSPRSRNRFRRRR